MKNLAIVGHKQVNSIAIVMYHYVRDINYTNYPNQKTLIEKKFIEQIERLNENYNFIEPGYFIDCINSNHFDFPENPVLLTFDDGFQEHYRFVYKELAERNIKAFFFPISETIGSGVVSQVHKIQFLLSKEVDFNNLVKFVTEKINEYRDSYSLESVDFYMRNYHVKGNWDGENVFFIKRMLQKVLPFSLRKKMVDELFYKYVTKDEADFSNQLYMNKDELKELHQTGNIIGNHTHTHEWLDKLNLEEQSYQIKTSLSTLKSLGIEYNTWSICYPYGKYDSKLDTCLIKNNITAGFVINNRNYIPSMDSSFQIPRIDTNNI